MSSLLNLVMQLREDILEYNPTIDDPEDLLDSHDIHRIRMGIKNIDDESIDRETLSFLNDSFEFDSIVSHFYEIAEFNEYTSFHRIVQQTLDPLCIYLMNNDYEVILRKINITDKVENEFPNLIELINSMEESYYNKEYQRVTTLSSTILQSLFKEICDLKGIEYSKSENFPNLYTKVRETLNLSPKDYQENDKLRKFSSKIQEVILAINELRNLYSEAHGVAKKDYFEYDSIPSHHIKLIVDSTKTIVNFFVESYEYQFESLNI